MTEIENSEILSSTNVNACEFLLPDVMTIENAEAVAEVFKSIPVFNGVHLNLDASKVEFITAPGMQLILALKNLVTKNEGALFIKFPSNAFMASAEDMGMQDLFNIIGEA